MDANDFAKVLMDEHRIEWQNPNSIFEQIGIGPGQRVADLACGPGFFTIVLSELVGEKGLVYAVDVNEIMIHNLKKNRQTFEKNGSNVVIMQADISKPSEIPAKDVDVVFFANILHDLEDKNGFFREVRRIAKNSDTLFVDVDWHKRDMEMGPPIDRRLSEGESRKILAQEGFEIVHAINAGPHHYGLVAKSRN